MRWTGRTCDGVLGEGLHVGQVVVWTVFLQPFADVLLGPQDDGADQAGLRWARVVYPIIVTGAVLKRGKGQKERDALNNNHEDSKYCIEFGSVESQFERYELKKKEHIFGDSRCNIESPQPRATLSMWLP